MLYCCPKTTGTPLNQPRPPCSLSLFLSLSISVFLYLSVSLFLLFYVYRRITSCFTSSLNNLFDIFIILLCLGQEGIHLDLNVSVDISKGIFIHRYILTSVHGESRYHHPTLCEPAHTRARHVVWCLRYSQWTCLVLQNSIYL